MTSKLKGRFVRINKCDGAHDPDESFWQIVLEDLSEDEDIEIMRFTIKELREQNPVLDYESIATPEFGKLLLRKAKQMKAFW